MPEIFCMHCNEERPVPSIDSELCEDCRSSGHVGPGYPSQCEKCNAEFTEVMDRLSRTSEAQKAARRLNRAAPELLAACKAYDAAWTKSCPEGPEAGAARLGSSTIVLWKQIRAAIAKATGEDPNAPAPD